MIAKPKQWSRQYAQVFQDWSVAEAYQYRPGYSPETWGILIDLIPSDQPAGVLDVGCGTGFLARELIRFVAHMDAVDFSSAAIQIGQQLAGGDDPRLRWVCSPVEAATLDPPSQLITAALVFIGWIGTSRCLGFMML